MNEKRKEWPDPCTGHKSSKSFIELFDDSLKLSTELINASLDYLKGNLDFEQIRNIIGNFSFITNTDVTSGVETMKYFNYLF
jgi:hypothetical protein